MSDELKGTCNYQNEPHAQITTLMMMVSKTPPSHVCGYSWTPIAPTDEPTAELRPSFNEAEAGWREADAHYLEMDRSDYIFRARRYITALEDALEQWEATQ